MLTIVCIGFKRVEINGISMEPTILNHDIVWMRRRVGFESINRFDIVFIKNPYGDNDLVVKRVVGLPNETIYCEHGIVYINEQKIKDRYNFDKNTENFGPFILGKEEYFVLGDNRKYSTDSRVFGKIKKKDIVGIELQR